MLEHFTKLTCLHGAFLRVFIVAMFIPAAIFISMKAYLTSQHLTTFRIVFKCLNVLQPSDKVLKFAASWGLTANLLLGKKRIFSKMAELQMPASRVRFVQKKCLLYSAEPTRRNLIINLTLIAGDAERSRIRKPPSQVTYGN